MRIGRPILVAVILSSFLACLLLAASRPIHVAPNGPMGDLAANNGQYMFRTLKNTTAGCGSCHGYLSSVKPAIIGPGNNSALYGRLAPGATGTFDMITVLDQTPYFQCSQG